MEPKFTYFTHSNDPDWCSKFLKYDWRTDKVTIIENPELFDFKKCMTVQVNEDIYALMTPMTLPTRDIVIEIPDLVFTRYRNVESQNPCKMALSLPQDYYLIMFTPFIVNFNNLAIYVIGGAVQSEN